MVLPFLSAGQGVPAACYVILVEFEFRRSRNTRIRERSRTRQQNPWIGAIRRSSGGAPGERLGKL